VTAVAWARTYRCDFCGATADAPEPQSLPGGRFAPPGPPAGWLSPGAADLAAERVILRVSVETANGERYGDVCGECQQVSLGGLLAVLRGRITRDRAAR
jgi:hypothetical protein